MNQSGKCNRQHTEQQDVGPLPCSTVSGLCLETGASCGSFINAMDYLPQGIRIIDADNTVKYTNPAFAELSGVSPEAAAGRKCWQVFHGPLCHTPECRLERIKQGEQAIQTEIVRVRPDGNSVPCIVSAYPLHTPDNRLIGIMESYRDITEKKKLEAHAREAEERCQAIIELGNEAGEAVVILQNVEGLPGVQTYLSDYWQAITGYSREELLGRCFFDLVPSEEHPVSIRKHLDSIIEKRTPAAVEMKIRRRDNSEAVLEINGLRANYLGRKACILYIRDITARKADEARLKESELRYRTLFEDVPVAIWELDYSQVKKFFDSLREEGVADIRSYMYHHPEATLHCLKLGTLYGVNKAVLEILEADYFEQLRGLFDLLKQRPAGFEQDRENLIAMAEGATEISYISREITFKNHWKWAHVQYRIPPEHIHDWKRVYGIFNDITERMEAEQELKAYEEHLKDLVEERTDQLKKEVERSKAIERKLRRLYKQETLLRKELEEQINLRIQFTRAVVHELKTPLTPLLGANELLSRNLKEEPWSRLAGQAWRGAKEIDQRIDQLFDLTRNEAGVLKLRYAWVDAEEIVEQVMDTLSLGEGKKQEAVKLEIPPDLPQIFCDGVRIRQVLTNLVDNAIVHNTPGTPIRLNVYRDAGKIVFKVADEGCGINSDKIKNIYTPFTMLDLGSENYSGLGLGLSICKTLVELHGGNIGVETMPGKGSSFWFDLPLNGRNENHLQEEKK